MASMRDIKRRKQSIQSTGQITKAMKLVSTVKLQKSKTRAEETSAYFKRMYKTVSEILSQSGNIDHPYLQGNGSTKKGIIVISSNRGLAGGYNMNVVKLVTNSGFKKEDCVIYAVGRKGKEILNTRGYMISEDYSETMSGPVFNDAIAIGRRVMQDFDDGKIGEIYLCYTDFKNTVSHIPTISKLLPVEKGEISKDDSDSLLLMNYEPNEEEALQMILPLYINSMIYGGLMQSYASENGARMQAMDSATNNATEMISDLTLKFNRARQVAITQEITEIVGGANAIS